MKVTSLLLFCVIMQVSASGYSQKAKLRISMMDAKITEVFEEIKKQSQFDFLYKSELVKDLPKVTVDFSKVTIAEILDDIIPNELEYEIFDKTIIIRKNPNPIKEEIVEEADIEISGKITDENNEGLPGASILIKGTSNGTTSDIEGNYKLSVPQDAILTISFVGYETKEIPVGNQSTIDLKMTVDAAKLDEIVVIGYGSVKKSDLTGSVATLNNEILTEQRKTDLGQALQGRVAGVDVRKMSSKPGAPLSIKIRGNTVITNTNQDRDGINDNLDRDLSKPLYVVDGIFFEDINVLNPTDIAKMDILKDASATAIYGSRGANGVVIITTKNGVEGRTTFSYEATFGVRTPTNVPDFYTGDEYVDFVDDLLRSRLWVSRFNNGTGTVDDFNNEVIDRSTEFRSSNEEADNVANGRYTDWLDLFQQKGIQTSHTIGMSGGSNGLVYNGSIGYLSDQGVIGIEGFKRYNLSASLSKKVNEKLTVGLKAYLAMSEREEGSRELFRSTFRLAPTVNPFDVNGDPILFPDDQDQRFANPYYDANGAWRVNTKTIDVIGNIFLNYKPTSWINFKTQIAPNLSSERFGEYRGLFTKAARNDPSRTRGIYNTNFGNSYTWDNILDFDFELADGHNLKATLINSVYSRQREGNSIQTRGFDTDAYLFYNTEGGSDIRDFDSFYIKETIASFAGRLNYNISDRYLFTVTGRYDGSSKLSTSNKWNFFPSAAFAWKLSEEEFMQNANWVNNLKLRLSYGESGNDASVSAYSSLAFLGASNYIFGNSMANGKVVSGLPNSDLTWETSKETNIGIDLGAFNNRVLFNMDYYIKKTQGSILARQLSDITGFNSSVGNFGSVQNSGIEITLNTVNVDRNDFTWTTSINFTKNTNKILELDGDLDEIPYRNHGVLKIGEAVDAIYAYDKVGIWQINEAEAAAVYNAFPGQYKYVDQNNDGIINQEDKVVIGSVSPSWTAGMTQMVSFKNLSMSVQVNTRQGVLGHSEFNQHFAPYQGDDAKFNKVDLDYWTPNNQDAEYPAPDYGHPGEWYFESFDFVRIGNIGFAYQVPQAMLDRLKVSNLRFSLDLQNPFTFTGYAGPDPETGLQNSYNMAYSVKTVLFGLKLSY